ncbi:ATP-dependent zinc protease family protein [Shewanella cyperi]|uniref:ATP-dependent zinc protease family protein n=1 Tax=Shewanella cyperi TaxID=2814292 RepID=UPI001D18A570|nr:ATP-dependent zinc protease [Shewanella cyperi]
MRQSLVFIMLAGLTACAGTPKEQPQGPIPTDKQQLIDNQQLSEQLAQTQSSIINAISAEQAQARHSLSAIHKQLDKLQESLKHEPQPLPAVVPSPEACEASPLSDKFVLGEVEMVRVDELKTRFPTRIDTGAESSSLDARNILVFERDGRKWVRFDVFLQGEDKPPSSFEAKVARFVRIKQDAEGNDERRPVIHAHLKIGKYSAETDLNLTDRSHLEYPLLLGRQFMKDIAVVDVSQSFIHGK